jgi:hypothetical protein
VAGSWLVLDHYTSFLVKKKCFYHRPLRKKFLWREFKSLQELAICQLTNAGAQNRMKNGWLRNKK